MRAPFLAEIKFIPARQVPEGWARCDGRQMCIADHPALFELIGTTYGGDGQSTFALPNLVGRKPVHIELHGALHVPANPSSRGLGLERHVQMHSFSPAYESTHFCIALEGIFPSGNHAADTGPFIF